MTPSASETLLPASAPAMEDLRSRDDRVLNQAWEKAWPLLWSFALGRLRHAWQRGLWDKLDLESCAAEAIRSITAEVAGRPPAESDDLGTFRQLLNAATRRAWQRSVDAWRRQGRPAPLLHAWDWDPPAETPDSGPPAAPAAALHDLGVVLDFIRAWAFPRREIFLLTYIDGMNSREVGEALSLTDTGVRTHLFRGREELWLAFPGLFESRRPARNPAAPAREVSPGLAKAASVTVRAVTLLWLQASGFFVFCPFYPS